MQIEYKGIPIKDCTHLNHPNQNALIENQSQLEGIAIERYFNHQFAKTSEANGDTTRLSGR